MKDYREQAELYVSDLNSGDIPAGSERFNELLGFLRSFRKRLGRDAAAAALHRDLVQLARKRLCAEIALPLSGRFRPINRGEAHLFAGLLKQGDRTWFVKAASSAAANELDAVKALLDGRLPRAGRHFAFLVPESVILRAGLVIYLSPAVADPVPLVQDFRREPNDVATIVRGLAEMNVSLGCFAPADCPLPLRRQDLALARIGRDRFRAVFPELDAPALDALWRRLGEIRALWPALEREAETGRWGLAHGDLASHNATVEDGRLLYLDLGAAGFGPLGSDLFWLLYKNRASPEDQRRIVATYCEELGRHGVAATEAEIHAAAMRRYAQKWLFPSRRGTKSNLGHIEDTQRAVLDMLHAQNVPADPKRSTGQ